MEAAPEAAPSAGKRAPLVVLVQRSKLRSAAPLPCVELAVKADFGAPRLPVGRAISLGEAGRLLGRLGSGTHQTAAMVATNAANSPMRCGEIGLEVRSADANRVVCEFEIVMAHF